MENFCQKKKTTNIYHSIDQDSKYLSYKMMNKLLQIYLILHQCYIAFLVSKENRKNPDS